MAFAPDYASGDVRWLRKDANDEFNAGLTTTWADAAGNFRFRDGKWQVQNDDTGLYHTVRCRNDDDGLPVLFVEDTGVA